MATSAAEHGVQHDRSSDTAAACGSGRLRGWAHGAWCWVGRNQWMIALGSVMWLLWRSGTQPRRLVYPCQKAAMANAGGLVIGLLPSALVGRGLTLRRGRFARQAVVVGRTLCMASLAFLLGWAGWRGYVYAQDTFGERVAASVPVASVLDVGPMDEQLLSSRLMAPSADEAIVAYRHTPLPLDGTGNVYYGQYPWHRNDNNIYYDEVWNTVASLHLGPSDNPLADLVHPGDKVLIKPNLMHSQYALSCTHVAILRPIVDMAAKAGAAEITIGDGVAEGTGFTAYNTAGITSTWITYMDGIWPDTTIRRVDFEDTAQYYWVTMGTDAGGASTYVGSGYSDSSLDPYTYTSRNDYYGTPSSPRVDARGVANTGNIMGWHPMSKYVMDADVVINVPRIKVHSHAVMTSAVKNWVGVSLAKTHVTREAFCRISHYVKYATNYQMVFGGDTMWRDVGDLQRATLYWDEGVVYPTPVRRYLVVCDGVEGAETNLQVPQSVKLGAILASVDPLAHDCVVSRLVGYDWRPKETSPGSGTWIGGVPNLNNNHAGASPGHPLGTNDVGRIRVIGDTIGPQPNHVFDFDYSNNGTRSWPDWNATKMTDFTPPAIGQVFLRSEGTQTSVHAVVSDAAAVYAYYGEDASARGAPYALRLARQGTSDEWVGTLPAGEGGGYVIAQDTNLNTARASFAWPGDYDQDGDVDLADFAVFQLCFNGPTRPYPYTGCVASDYDVDGDVDLGDFSVFLSCFNGPTRPPACQN